MRALAPTRCASRGNSPRIRSIHVRNVPDELHRSLQERAAREGTTMRVAPRGIELGASNERVAMTRSTPPRGVSLEELRAEANHAAQRLALYRRKMLLGQGDPRRLADMERISTGAASRLERAQAGR
jgi:plasmid stability protein